MVRVYTHNSSKNISSGPGLDTITIVMNNNISCKAMHTVCQQCTLIIAYHNTAVGGKLQALQLATR